MSRRKTVFVSPIDPRIHFILFLILALILVVFVGGVLQNTTSDARAFLMCGGRNTQFMDRAKACGQYGYTIVKDENGCLVPTCKSAPAIIPSLTPNSVR